MLSMLSVRLILTSAAIAAGIACGDNVVESSDRIIGIQVEPRNLGLFEGVQGTFYARAITRDGPTYRLDPEPVLFISRDTTVLAITPFGVATGIKLGSAWIVATFESAGRVLTDSLRVVVTRYADR